MTSQELDRRLLDEVEAGRAVSQRSLARSLGVALGLTNLLMRRLIKKGLVRIIRVKPNRVRYVITPSGVAAKARMTRAYLERSISFYVEARSRLHESFSRLSAEWPADGAPDKRIVFYGTGELAEIAFVCLQESDLSLMGVVDEGRAGRPFFGLPVHPAERLRGATLDGIPFGRIVIMSLGDGDARERLQALGCPNERIYSL